jgi:hypothetical protein
MADPQKRIYYRPRRTPRPNEMLRPSTSEVLLTSMGRTFTYAYPILPDAILPAFRTLTPIDAPGACPSVLASSLTAAQITCPIYSSTSVDCSDTESTDTAPWIRRPIPPECEDYRTRRLPRKRPRPRAEPIQQQTPQPRSAKTQGNMVVTSSPLVPFVPVATKPIVFHGAETSAGPSGTGMPQIPLPGDRAPAPGRPPIPPPRTGPANSPPTNMPLSTSSGKAYER